MHEQTLHTQPLFYPLSCIPEKVSVNPKAKIKNDIPMRKDLNKRKLVKEH